MEAQRIEGGKNIKTPKKERNGMMYSGCTTRNRVGKEENIIVPNTTTLKV